MLRRDFISKIIEQMVNAVARLLELNGKEEPQKFLNQFDELMNTYFKLNSDKLNLLLENEEERDALLLDEKLKNYQIRMFIDAGFAFIETEQSEKAKICVQIIERIQQQHSNVFEFPTIESSKITQDLIELKELISV
ncbi:hypothetical protein [Moheibacter sediminis]|uniref:Uncharacterized protein n=1 Tax=Moheibacter sediminis TaxID=1434700 RepID=A0A1W1YBC3_9FLAO|nr:hypothetical protein [Moheibacter sediminis]SMC33028.1 hypothetical protein SAMN06296427_101168 [Moheibacter sediminis]